MKRCLDKFKNSVFIASWNNFSTAKIPEVFNIKWTNGSGLEKLKTIPGTGNKYALLEFFFNITSEKVLPFFSTVTGKFAFNSKIFSLLLLIALFYSRASREPKQCECPARSSASFRWGRGETPELVSPWTFFHTWPVASQVLLTPRPVGSQVLHTRTAASQVLLTPRPVVNQVLLTPRPVASQVLHARPGASIYGQEDGAIWAADG